MTIELIESFKGTCRDKEYLYRVIREDRELILESYDDTGLVDTLTWHDSKHNLRLIKAACETIRARR